MQIPHLSIVKRPTDGYPWFPPFNPSESYPEHPFSNISPKPNEIYGMVRQVLWDLGLDAARRGTPKWNPLGDFVKPGQTIVIKPNFVINHNWEHTGRAARAAVVTDGSVLRPIVDFAFKACGPTGKIIICETPIQNEVSSQMMETIALENGTRAVVDNLKARGVPVELIDLRSVVRRTNRLGFWRWTKCPGDPLGYVAFDLGKQSAFEGIPSGHMRTNDWEDVSQYHSAGRHEYSVSKTILSADFVINVPKLKVHKKTGITAAVKNMYALSNRKDRIPHWQHKVDDHASSYSWLHESLRYCFSKRWLHPIGWHLSKILRVKLDGYGNWPGNDTTWRGVVDLNRILQYGDINGKLHDKRQRRVLSIVDGIIAGERMGPLTPKPRQFGVIVAGLDAVRVDINCAHLMQMDARKIKLLLHAINAPAPALTDCTLADLEPNPEVLKLSEPFELPIGWEDSHLNDQPALPKKDASDSVITVEPENNYRPNPY